MISSRDGKCDSFITYCERLWQDWNGGFRPSSVSPIFADDAAPEPYLFFGACTAPLVVVTTNPGRAEEHSMRRAVRPGQRPFDPSLTYADVARALGDHYTAPGVVISPAARRRIDALRQLAETIGQRRGTRVFDGVMQVEACPFHSKSLPKRPIIRAMEVGGVLADYSAHAREFLADKSVLILSAAAPDQSLVEAVRWSHWVYKLAEIAGLKRAVARHDRLIFKNGGKLTCACWVSKQNGVWKALVLMMGGNHLPGLDGLKRLADALCADICQTGHQNTRRNNGYERNTHGSARS